jgi:hypothetical protein
VPATAFLNSQTGIFYTPANGIRQTEFKGKCPTERVPNLGEFSKADEARKFASGFYSG